MRNFDNWLQGYLSYTFASEAPERLHFWTGVATIAGALGRKVWIDQLTFKWRPNFYIVLVGPAGTVTKSTTLDLGMRLLAKIGAKFGPPSLTWQALLRSLNEAITEKKYWDPQGVEQVMKMSSITVPVSELGTFLKTADNEMMNVLTELWDGRDSFSHKTVTDGEVIVTNPWINIIGCTTPTWMQAHFPEHMIGGGLTSRIIFIYSDTKRKLVPYPKKVVKPEDFLEVEKGLWADLAEMQTLVGEYLLTSEAEKWGEQWYEEHHDKNKRPAHLASARYGGYIARKQAHIHKLAMVLSAARSNKLVIEKEVLEEAAILITDAEPDMLKVFESIGQSSESRRVEAMVAMAQALKFVPTTKLWELCQRTMEYRDFQSSLKAAIEGNRLRAVAMPDALGNPVPGVIPR